jgi:hypothetical protein
VEHKFNGEYSCTGQLGEGVYGEIPPKPQPSLTEETRLWAIKGYVKGDVVILKELLAVPDGTEVEIFIPPAKDRKRKGRGL